MYCIKCGRENEKLEGNCQYCGEPLVEHDLDHEETRLLNKALHNRINVSREKVDNSLSLIVLGSTFLIIGILFFFLSFKLPNAAAHNKVVTVTCFEFWVSMAGLGAGAVLLIWGLIKLIRELLVEQKEALRVLKAVQNGRYHHMQIHSLEESKE